MGLDGSQAVVEVGPELVDGMLLYAGCGFESSARLKDSKGYAPLRPEVVGSLRVE